MSLFDYLNNDGSSTSSLSAQMQVLLQQAAAKAGAATSTSTSTDAATAGTTVAAAATPSVLITLDAQRASAEADDAKKDANTLAKESREALDKNGASATGAMSGRALAIVALNGGGSFSRAEIDAAKSELRERDRTAVLAFFNSGELTASSLKAYGQKLLAARQSMSAEEQQLRSSDPNLR